MPKHPSDLIEHDSKSPGGRRSSGHEVIGYFSSLTGKAAPLEFRKGDEQVVVQRQTAVAVNESTAHLSALLSGLGIGQTFRFAVAPHLTAGRLQTVLDDWSRPRHPLNVIYPSNRHLSAKLRIFVDWVAKCSPRSTICNQIAKRNSPGPCQGAGDPLAPIVLLKARGSSVLALAATMRPFSAISTPQ